MKLKFKHIILLLSVIYLALANMNVRPSVPEPADSFQPYYLMGEYDTTTIDIDKRLVHLLDEFKKDAEYYGYDTKFINELNSIKMGTLDSVMIEGKERNLHGVCLISFDKGNRIGNIILSENLFYTDPYGFRLVFYHEIGHWMGKDHLPHITNKEDLFMQLGILNVNRFFGIMHDGYNVNDSEYVKNMWIPLKHNFFVRDMPLEEQKEYTYKVVCEQVEEEICVINDSGDTSELVCDELFHLEDLKYKLDSLTSKDMEGLFPL